MTFLLPEWAGGGQNGSCHMSPDIVIPWAASLNLSLDGNVIFIVFSPFLTPFPFPVSLQGAPGEAGMSIIGPRGPPVSDFTLYFWLIQDVGKLQGNKHLGGAARQHQLERAKPLYNVVPMLSQAWFYTAIIYYV